MSHCVPLALGFFLDFFWGDPPWFVQKFGHPVIFIGNLIKKTEAILLKSEKEKKQILQVKGFLLFLLVVSISTGFVFFTVSFAYSLQFYLGFILETLIYYQLFATHSLEVESMKVYDSLKNATLEDSRVKLSYIVGRNTEHLEGTQIIKATVETIAENTTDAVIAPFFSMFFFGVSGGMFYKAVNTLDSMVGYKNEKYQYFGTVSAKMDDILNYIPARCSAIFLIISCFFLKLDVKNAWNIFLRDRYCHKSPNSAQTESVVAGALGVQLAGDAIYFGKLHKKETIGDALREVTVEDIKTTNKLMKCSAVLSFILLFTVKFVLEGVF